TQRSSGPELTSTNCIRPYGTTLSLRNSTPCLTSRSSSRSEYPQARQLRGISQSPHTRTTSASAVPSAVSHQVSNQPTPTEMSTSTVTQKPSSMRRSLASALETGCQCCPNGAKT